MATTPKQTSPVYIPTRRIPEWNRILLCTRAGGHCEFDGCNRYLFEHHVTFEEGNFAEFAHMAAFSVDGPRGREERPDDINSLENLMLLCPTCHKLIDDNPEKYSVETLRSYKESHERQINELTGMRPEMRSTALIVKSRVRDQTVEIPFDHVLEAMAPRHPFSKQGCVIDLTAFPHGPHFTQAACDAIRENLKVFHSQAGEICRSKHISLFALAPIPVLMFLGHQLGNKVPLDLFQRHRDTERWRWKSDSEPVEYAFRQVRQGTDATKVALLLSLSGTIPIDWLPASIDAGHTIYEITPANAVADATLVKRREDLENFRVRYQQAVAAVVRHHSGAQAVEVFPAVPAPIAVLCGRELLPRVHPTLNVYDRDKDQGYVLTLTLNP